MSTTLSTAVSQQHSASSATARKVLVAIHGVGDQFNYETIQSVARRLSAYYGERSAIPLGSFWEVQETAGARVLMSPPPHGVPSGIGFTEVYWAPIAREVVKRGYELEESKKWAKTIVGRVAANARVGTLTGRDIVLMENVLEGLIETVAVLERLCFIAEKAGVFNFSLQRILADFVNDVQLVTDFASYRRDIVDKFDSVLSAVTQRERTAEIYLIAHSEGTVVALAGLVRAIGAQPRPDWLDRVRGVMTIGSPLDTHILLWPDLWRRLEPSSPWTPAAPIRWLNYYDRGDPIADALTTTEEWLNAHACRDVFAIENVGFSRYYFPGKAHIDYWTDEEVFGHFIEEVTGLPSEVPPATAAVENGASAGAESSPPAPPRRRFPNKPGSKALPSAVCYLAPYTLIAALFFAAAFIMFRSARSTAGFDVAIPLGAPQILRDVAGLAALLAGSSVAIRIPRLTTMWRWRLLGAAAFVAGAIAYAWPIWTYEPRAMERASQDTIADAFNALGLPAALADWALVLAAVAVVAICAVLGHSQRWNRISVRVLLVSGGVVVVGLVASLVGESPDRGPLWPLVLASAAFFYLWWLAVLLFDLVFVWHRYIRHSVAVRDLRQIRKPDASAH